MKKKEFLEVKNELLEVENEADLRDLLLLVPEKYGIGHMYYIFSQVENCCSKQNLTFSLKPSKICLNWVNFDNFKFSGFNPK